jgi:hypothetical protein
VKNTLTCRYSISHEGSGYTSGSSFDLSISGNSYSGSITISGLDYKNAYIVGVNAYDELDEVQINNQRTIGKPVFDWDNTEVNFNTDVRVRGNLRLKGDGNYGNTLYFGDGAYAYMTEATDDDLTFHSSDLTLDATNLTLKSTNNAKLTGSIDVSKSVNVSLDVNCSNTVNAARVNIGGKDVGGQTFLHTDTGRYMHDKQEIKLTGNNRITKQINGYIIVWMRYSNGSVYANDSTYTFIPKVVANFNSGRITLPIAREDGTVVGSKLLFITDDGATTKIAGSSTNDDAPNNGFVLKHIISW